MPWPKEHKRNTRERIIEAAAAAFREHGIDGVGVADVMRNAGLTHGGFYAHFASKEDLLASAVQYASEQVTEMLDSATDPASSQRLLGAALKYLSAAHRDHPEWGCPIATLGPNLARSGQKARRTLANDIRKRLKQLHDLTPDSLPAETRTRQAAGALACTVGGLIVARVLEESQGAEFLKSCHEFLRETLVTNNRRKPSA